ncbi:MAG: sulfate transporter CysZ [Alteromonadaceae bacterium]|uniref:sulfate transporter CysZ n=1 Tax=unclassified Marinobacter TaxID=83889 RepID=UPI000C4A9049|nr:sulfate transporter CysZ [Marinobacter sp. BGYM27]MAA65925.1 sulfate transporter CysZ [Alteromonadaceae bacterium]MBH84878.1 sulfate transporter CysZ [Alteromonadaceae bacterium]MDG5501065.1 sulfate transporter CysZ [Marinobacter sp. BGYM27]|tara:strand:- start:33159 stop:33932 length:774 start_codon:yes stop_codon:yes gene_type:complete
MLKGNFFHGLGYLGEGFRLIRQPGLRLFVIIPLVINIFLFGLLFYFLAGAFGSMIDAAMGWLPDWQWLQSLDWLFWLLYGLVILLMLAYGFVIVANLIGSPFYGYLAELTEKHLTGQEVASDEGWMQLVRDIPRSLGREVRKIIYYLPRALFLLIIGLIPVVNLVAAALWFLFNSWMMSLQYVDYPADNHKVSFDTLRSGLASRRLSALGFGLPVALAAMVPILNLFVVPAAVCGATAYWVREQSSFTELPAVRRGR